MRYARLVRIELAVTARQLVPDRSMRMLALAAMAVLIAAMMAITAQRSRPPLTSRTAIPVFTIMIGLSLSAGLAGASRIQAREAAGTPWRIAPVSAAAATFIPLSSILVMCGAAVSVVTLPLMSGAIASNDGTLAAALVMSAVAALCGCASAVWLVAAVRRQFGAESARRIGSALPSPISFVAVFGSRLLTPYSSGAAAVLAVGATAIVLPFIAERGARSWMHALGSGWSEFSAGEPVWGTPGWWRLLAQRTPFLWGLAGLVPLAFAPAPAGAIVIRTIAVFLPTLGLTHLVRWENACPDRIELAPGARRYFTRMFIEIGAPLFVISAIAIAAAAASAKQAGWLGALAIPAALTVFIRPRAFRLAAQLVIALAAIAISARG